MASFDSVSDYWFGGSGSMVATGDDPVNLSTTDPKPGVDVGGVSIDWGLGTDSITITGTTDMGGGTSGFGSFTFDLPSGSLDHVTLGFSNDGTTGSFTFDLDGGFSETFSHDFGGGIDASVTFSANDAGSSVMATWDFHF